MSAGQVSAEQWGNAALEEVLFRAAAQAGALHALPREAVEVDVRFRITAEAGGILEISIESETEGQITTRLQLPF